MRYHNIPYYKHVETAHSHLDCKRYTMWNDRQTRGVTQPRPNSCNINNYLFLKHSSSLLGLYPKCSSSKYGWDCMWLRCTILGVPVAPNLFCCRGGGLSRTHSVGHVRHGSVWPLRSRYLRWMSYLKIINLFYYFVWTARGLKRCMPFRCKPFYILSKVILFPANESIPSMLLINCI